MPTPVIACRGLPCFVVLAWLLALPAVAPAETPRPAPLDGFDRRVAGLIGEWRTPGLAIVIVTTKAMTAALVGMMVDEGKLAWDDPVTRHLWDRRWLGTALVTFVLDPYGEPATLEAMGARFARKIPTP